MSGPKMKESGEMHVYSAVPPPPYTPQAPSYAPTVVQPGPSTVIHPGTTTVIHSPGVVTVGSPGTSAIVVTNQMSPNSSTYTCPSCHQQIFSRVEYKPSTRTHLYALLLCVLALWPCVVIPYCMPSCNKAHHFCPNCNAYIGS